MRIVSIISICAAVTAVPAAAVDWNNPQSIALAAAEVSPSLLALKSQIAAARERVTSAGSLPNPMLMGGVQNQQIDLSIDRMMTMYMVGASQTITRRSRRNALRTAAELDVDRLEHESEAQRTEVERDALVAWYDAAAAQSEADATGEIASLAGTVAEAARIRYESGAAAQFDMIRAKLQASDIRHQLLTLRGRRQQAIARLIALLHLPADASVPAFAMGHQHDADEEATTVPDRTPAIAAVEAELRRADEEIRLAKLAAKPDWNIEASYGVRPYEKDMISVVGRIELPIRRRTIIEPRIREAIAQRDAAIAQIAVLQQQLRQDLGVASAIRSEAREQISLHMNELVPQAKLGFESALAAYQAGKETFESTLASLQSYVALTVDYFEFLRQERQADAAIDAIRRGARSGVTIGSMRR